VLNRYRRRRHSPPPVFGCFLGYDYYDRLSYDPEAVFDPVNEIYEGRITDFEGRVSNLSLWFLSENKCFKVNEQFPGFFQDVLESREISGFDLDAYIFFSSDYVYFWAFSHWRDGENVWDNNEVTLGRHLALFKFTKGMKLMKVWEDRATQIYHQYEGYREPHPLYSDILIEEFGSRGHEGQSGFYSVQIPIYLVRGALNYLSEAKVIRFGERRTATTQTVRYRYDDQFNYEWEGITEAKDIPYKSMIRHFDLPIESYAMVDSDYPRHYSSNLKLRHILFATDTDRKVHII
jgi:hypothetical protein